MKKKVFEEKDWLLNFTSRAVATYITLMPHFGQYNTDT